MCEIKFFTLTTRLLVSLVTVGKEHYNKPTTKVTFFLVSACVFPAAALSGSGLEGDLFGMGMWSLGLGAVGAALAGILLANTDLCLTKPAKASLEYLEDADLCSTIGGKPVLISYIIRHLHHVLDAFA